MDTRTKEAVRYLGYGRHAVDDHTLALVESSFMELEEAAGRRIIYHIFDLDFQDDGCIQIGQMNIESRNLRKNMNGCEKAIVLGATLGAQVDLLMRKHALSDMARVVTLQACATTVLEEYLDDWQGKMEEEMAKEGLYLRPRFSPGYGDFSIGHQEEILRMLDAAKTIGLTMTAGGMLTPMKSVTAVIGLSRIKAPCHIKGCEACEKTDCVYRRCS